MEEERRINVIAPVAVTVTSWGPTPNEPTQVHLAFSADPGDCETKPIAHMLRFKGPDTLDRLIVTLMEHRDRTFGVAHGFKWGLVQRDGCAPLLSVHTKREVIKEIMDLCINAARKVSVAGLVGRGKREALTHIAEGLHAMLMKLPPA